MIAVLADITYICMDCDTRYKKQCPSSNQPSACPECGSFSILVPLRSIGWSAPDDDVCKECHGTGKTPVRAGERERQELRQKVVDCLLLSCSGKNEDCCPGACCFVCDDFDRERYEADKGEW